MGTTRSGSMRVLLAAHAGAIDGPLLRMLYSTVEKTKNMSGEEYVEMHDIHTLATNTPRNMVNAPPCHHQPTPHHDTDLDSTQSPPSHRQTPHLQSPQDNHTLQIVCSPKTHTRAYQVGFIVLCSTLDSRGIGASLVTTDMFLATIVSSCEKSHIKPDMVPGIHLA